MPVELAIGAIALVMYSLAFMVVGATVDRWLFREQLVTVAETPAGEQRQADGSVILHRDPAAKPEAPAPEIPKGGTVTRTGEITILPPEITVTCEEGGEVRAQCPPITARFDIVRMLDGTHRAIASTDSGEILGGIDIPREPAVVVVTRKHGVGAALYANGAQAIRYTRDIGRMTVSGELLAPDGFKNIDTAADITPGVGITFKF